MTPGAFILWCLVVLVGLCGSALCSGLEVGFYTVNRVLVRVHAAGGKGRIGARILQAQLDRPAPTLTALLIWNNIFNFAATLALTTLVATIGLGDLEMILIQVVAVTPVLLVLGESTPKEVFRANADRLMERFAIPVRVLRLSMTIVPVVPLLTAVANGATRLIGIGSLGSLADSRERIAELLKFGSRGMSEAQLTLIDRALQLEHATIRSEMIPIRRAAALRSTWTIERARTYVRAHPFSRYPVMGHKGQVVGVVQGIDLYVHPRAQDGGWPVTGVMSEPRFLEAHLPVEQGLAGLSRVGSRMGIVRHNGREIGIVTRKDLVEPLVGELEDW